MCVAINYQFLVTPSRFILFLRKKKKKASCNRASLRPGQSAPTGPEGWGLWEGDGTQSCPEPVPAHRLRAHTHTPSAHAVHPARSPHAQPAHTHGAHTRHMLCMPTQCTHSWHTPCKHGQPQRPLHVHTHTSRQRAADPSPPHTLRHSPQGSTPALPPAPAPPPRREGPAPGGAGRAAPLPPCPFPSAGPGRWDAGWAPES